MLGQYKNKLRKRNNYTNFMDTLNTRNIKFQIKTNCLLILLAVWKILTFNHKTKVKVYKRKEKWYERLGAGKDI